MFLKNNCSVIQFFLKRIWGFSQKGPVARLESTEVYKYMSRSRVLSPPLPLQGYLVWRRRGPGPHPQDATLWTDERLGGRMRKRVTRPQRTPTSHPRPQAEAPSTSPSPEGVVWRDTTSLLQEREVGLGQGHISIEKRTDIAKAESKARQGL